MSFADRGITTPEAIITKFPQPNRPQRISPRTVLSLGVCIVVLHIIQEAFLGSTAAGSLIANLLQILAALLAASTCFASQEFRLCAILLALDRTEFRSVDHRGSGLDVLRVLSAQPTAT